MRRYSMPLTCLFALLPVLGLGCSKMEAAAPDYAGGDYYSDSEYAEAPAYEEAAKSADPSPDYAVADEAAPAPAATASAAPVDVGEGVGGMADMDADGAMMMEAEAPAPAPAGGRKGGRAKAKMAKKAESKAASRREAKEAAKIARERDRVAANIQSGTLTAGSFDDNLNPWVFDRFVDQAMAQPGLSSLAAAFAGPRTVLRVQDERGRPLGNAKVTIDGKHMTTRSDGRVVWVGGWDSGSQGQGKATISHGNSRKTVQIADQVEQMVTLDGAQASLPSRLDIALVIDATGSMGDELEYLKVEIRDIAEAVNHHFPGVEQRFALVVYRDKGDSYVTRSFDFTTNLDSFQRDLSEQSAGGGGDYPEAMDAAMAKAAKLSWSKQDAARVTFLVADAPPHQDKADDTLAAVDKLRAKGVAVYPVASSGVAGEAEFVMRSAALLTGAQYLFLTDDSGVGNPHAEPHIPCYTVEQLAPLMVRAVRSELSGRRVETEPEFAIRTVGQGQGGVCAKPRKSKKMAR